MATRHCSLKTHDKSSRRKFVFVFVLFCFIQRTSIGIFTGGDKEQIALLNFIFSNLALDSEDHRTAAAHSKISLQLLK